MARKNEIELHVDSEGNITVKKDAGMDVGLLIPDEGKVTFLNPRKQVLLRKEGNQIVGHDIPENTKLVVTHDSPATVPSTDETTSEEVSHE